MKPMIVLLTAGVLVALPVPSFAVPVSTHGSTNGAGWVHLNSPATTGQPGAECGEEDALFSPGRASDARGSAFNEIGIAHGVYAGEQDQNSRNTASVSQYDSACLGGPPL